MISRAGWATTPAITPPTGMTSNLIDPPNIGYQIMLTNIICAVIIVGIGAVRIFTRLFIVRALGPDDYFCLCVIVSWFGAVALVQLVIHYGMGKHLWDVSLADYSPCFLLVWMLASAIYIAIMLLIKFSILMMYRRLFSVVGSFATRWWLVTFFTFAYSIAGIIATICTCTPITAAWDITVTASQCINSASFYIANGVLNSVSDILILALPIPIVWGLALKLREKIVLSGLFGLGGVSCIVSIVRLKSLTSYLLGDETDITYKLTNVCVWTQIELTVAMVCACAPTLKPFMDRYCGNLWHTAAESSKVPSNGHGRSITEPSYGMPVNIELEDYPKGTYITSHAVDSDTESTDQIIRHEPYKNSPSGSTGIMVETSYQVQSTTASAYAASKGSE